MTDSASDSSNLEIPVMTTEALQVTLNRHARAHTAFVGLVILSIIIFWRTFHALVLFSLDHESSSHILLIPLVSIYLLWTERSRIFQVVRPSPVSGTHARSGGNRFVFVHCQSLVHSGS